MEDRLAIRDFWACGGYISRLKVACGNTKACFVRIFVGHPLLVITLSRSSSWWGGEA